MKVGNIIAGTSAYAVLPKLQYCPVAYIYFYG